MNALGAFSNPSVTDSVYFSAPEATIGATSDSKSGRRCPWSKTISPCTFNRRVKIVRHIAGSGIV